MSCFITFIAARDGSTNAVQAMPGSAQRTKASADSNLARKLQSIAKTFAGP